MHQLFWLSVCVCGISSFPKPPWLPRVNLRALHIDLATARLAQSAERKALNLVVVGSSPTVGVYAVSTAAAATAQFPRLENDVVWLELAHRIIRATSCQHLADTPADHPLQHTQSTLDAQWK